MNPRRIATGRNQATYDRFSAAVDGPMLVISVLWLPVLIVPMIARLTGDVATTFDFVDYVIWALFAAEYLAKLYLAPSRWAFIKSHVLDLVVVAVPMFRVLRVLRIIRVLRIGIIVQRSIARARSILFEHGLHFVLLAAVVVLFASAALELSFERNAVGANIHTYREALWWAISTVTTVGYGDRFPVTAGGQGVAVVLMLCGIGLIGVITANIASFFVQQRTDPVREELVALRGQIAHLEHLLRERDSLGVN
jgi:voltage-gated potassium channel